VKAKAMACSSLHQIVGECRSQERLSSLLVFGDVFHSAPHR
jgi:hypothetical protein